jgi:hypothetical protein
MHSFTPRLDAQPIRRTAGVLVVACALLVPLVAAPDSPAGPRAKLSQALLGGGDAEHVRQPRPDGIGSLGTELIVAIDKTVSEPGPPSKRAMVRAARSRR